MGNKLTSSSFDDTHREKFEKQLNTRICKESVKIESWLTLIDSLNTFLPAIKFYKSQCLTLKNASLHRCDSPNNKK